MQVPHSETMLGRIFNGSGSPRDERPVIKSNPVDLGSPAVNPVKRRLADKMIHTGIPMIDVFNTLVESQKRPIFFIAGAPYTVGSAVSGAWAKEVRQGKTLNFSYVILIGMPLSQTIYGFILVMVGLAPLIVGDNPVTRQHAGTLLGIGLAGGLAAFFSAWVQGRIGASACRPLSESDGKGLVMMIIAMGIVETVGLFGFVFLLMVLP